MLQYSKGAVMIPKISLEGAYSDDSYWSQGLDQKGRMDANNAVDVDSSVGIEKKTIRLLRCFG